jgi:hypothetical protein
MKDVVEKLHNSQNKLHNSLIPNLMLLRGQLFIVCYRDWNQLCRIDPYGQNLGAYKLDHAKQAVMVTA